MKIIFLIINLPQYLFIVAYINEQINSENKTHEFLSSLPLNIIGKPTKYFTKQYPIRKKLI